GSRGEVREGVFGDCKKKKALPSPAPAGGGGPGMRVQPAPRLIILFLQDVTLSRAESLPPEPNQNTVSRPLPPAPLPMGEGRKIQMIHLVPPRGRMLASAHSASEKRRACCDFFRTSQRRD